MYTTIHLDIRTLRGLLREFAAQMDTGEPYGRDELLARRIDFSRKFQAYLVTLGTLAADSSLATKNPPAGRAAQTAIVAIRLLLREYSAHLQSWSPREIDADWPGYCDSVRYLQKSLHALFDVQERDLLPLLRGTRMAA